MATSRTTSRGIAIALSTSLLLTACDQLQKGEMDWARAALERNDALEIVATDQESGAFTVRVRKTGELRIVKADELMAALPGADASSGAAATPDEPATAQEPASTPATAAPPAEPAEEPASPEPAAPASDAESTEPALAQRPTQAVASADGNVIKSGPGYTIKVADPVLPSQARTASASAAPAPTSASVEHRSEPIICQGARLLHIDNRNLSFEGDAVAAEAGCEIHITNSRITAGGVGVSAKAANVHIKNSTIEGKAASIETSDGAQVYAQSSTFRGLSRRLDDSVFHDLGGNVWN